MSVTEANRKRFDEMASEYDTKPWQKTLFAMLLKEVRDRIDWIGFGQTNKQNENGEARLLDYACGTGFVSRALGPYVTQIRGIDLSSNMVSEYNSRAVAAGFSPAQMSAINGNLLSSEPDPQLSNPDLFNFDVAAVGLGFHHFENVILATKVLSERLKPGGIFFVIDFVTESDKDTLPKHAYEDITEHGFNEAGMRAMFEKAGLEDFGFSALQEKAKLEMHGVPVERTVFIAKGKRTAL